MTKGEFIKQSAIMPDETRIIVEKKEKGIYEEFPVKKIVFINDEIHISI